MSRLRKALEKAQQGEGPAAFMVDETMPGQAEPAVDLHQQRSPRVDVNLAAAPERRLVAFLDDHPVAEQFRKLRTQVHTHMRNSGDKVFMVVSPEEGDGRTLTALNLAISMAREMDQTVLLVDADLRDPSVAQMLDLQPDKGLADYLEGNAEISDLLLHTSIGKLSLLPGCGHRGNSAELLDSMRTRDFIAELKGRYPDRCILLDTPAMSAAADPLILSQWVDRILLVVRDGWTKSAAVSDAVSKLPEQKLLGCVLTGSVDVPGGQ
jgi:exopolysaccharide/PEP-CTERM locus tyrosine autokinase